MMTLFVKACHVFSLAILVAFSGCTKDPQANRNRNIALAKTESAQLTYTLPPHKTNGTISVERALEHRRSHRQFQNRDISAEQLSQILWAAYGITGSTNDPSTRGGLRTTPSAGALYPLEIYVVVGNVAGIEVGVYKYVSQEHKLTRTIDKDIRSELATAAANQTAVRSAPVTVVYSAVFSRIEERYGKRGLDRYVFMEIGHSAQNVYLQAETLGLGTCAIGAFDDDKVSQLLRLPEGEHPFYLMPIGYYD